jgi:hypothetical protein
MKSSIFALLAASFVAAQNFDGIPECAQKCLEEAIPEAGCDIDDSACQCRESTQARLQTLAAPCILRDCDASEQIQALQNGQALCASLSRTATDQGTDGSMTIMPTDSLPLATPTGDSITTVSQTSIVTPPSGGNTTTSTSTRTTTGGSSDETGGSGDGSDGDNGGENSTDAAPMATAGLLAALLAAAVAI